MGGLRTAKQGCYTVKSYDNNLYSWCPEEPTYNKTVNKRSGKKFFCDAIPGSQGQDWICTYVYNAIVTPSGEHKRLAYVACDYVE